MRTLRIFFCLLAAALFCAAADRALLIGVGQYADPGVPSLPGIDHDVSLHAEALRRLGFQPGDIHILMDARATLANIRAEIKNWLANGTGANSRVVFYFSGHGSLSRDDQGREVGVLVPHDTRIGNGRLINALAGPDLGQYLSAIPSRNVLIVADACHSGHMTDRTKGLRDVVSKFLQYPGMPTGQADLNVSAKGIVSDKYDRMNHILLSACRREETAGATPNGSVLTVAMSVMVDELLRERRPVTMAATHSLVLSALMENKRDQHPELSGDDDLKQVDWARGSGGATGPDPSTQNQPGQQHAPDWELLQRLYTLRTGQVNVRINKDNYRNGETMMLDVDLPSDGYVNIIAIGSKDREATVLFPNQYAQDNRVRAGRFHIPNTGDYTLSQEASSPEEDELIVVFSSREMNLYRDGSGKDAFRKMGNATRSTVVRPTNGAGGTGNGYFAGFVTYRIHP